MTEIITPTPIPALPPPGTHEDTVEVFRDKNIAYINAQASSVESFNLSAKQTNQNALATEELANLAGEYAQDANQERLAAEAAAAQAMMAPTVGDTSTTSLTLTTGLKTLTVSADKPFYVGMTLLLASGADPTNKRMWGIVQTYAGSTLDIEITSVIGSGSAADWSISATNLLDDGVTQSGAQELNHKTFGQVLEKVHRVNGSGALAVNPTTASIWRIALAGNTTLSIRAPLADGEQVTLYIVQGSPARTVTWPANVRHDGGVLPVMPATAGNRTTVGLLAMDGVWYAYVGGINHAGA